jgi:hypothetical protein
MDRAPAGASICFSRKPDPILLFTHPSFSIGTMRLGLPSIDDHASGSLKQGETSMDRRLQCSPGSVKKPYSAPSLINLDLSAAKAKLVAEGDLGDSVVQRMLSLIDKQLNKAQSLKQASPGASCGES